MKKNNIDWQGHRGCRGILPENSIPAFIHAIDLGVNTLEMDVCVSKDKKIIITHEPWLSSTICESKKQDIKINEHNEKDFKIMEMTAVEIKDFDCGSKGNPRFPEQQKKATHKPSLTELFENVEKHLKVNNKNPVLYNIEVKSYKDWYDIFIPKPEEFVDILVNELKSSGIDKKRFVIQSFDLDILRIMNKKYPEYTLALLIESEKNVEINIRKLGFTPPIYSPYYMLLDQGSIDYCKENKIRVIPWTVNEIKDMERLIELGVDGIITDYPNRIKGVRTEIE